MSAVFTYSEARQNLASLLDKAAAEGEVRIRRRDGRTFVVRLQEVTTSPLDVKGIDLDMSLDEILGYIQEGRRNNSHVG